MDLNQSLPPEPPPISQPPPARSTGVTAIVLALVGLVLFSACMAWHSWWVSPQIHPPGWSILLRKALLAASGMVVASAMVVALTGIRQARAINAVALALCTAWGVSFGLFWLGR